MPKKTLLGTKLLNEISNGGQQKILKPELSCLAVFNNGAEVYMDKYRMIANTSEIKEESPIKLIPLGKNNENVASLNPKNYPNIKKMFDGINSSCKYYPQDYLNFTLKIKENHQKQLLKLKELIDYFATTSCDPVTNDISISITIDGMINKSFLAFRKDKYRTHTPDETTYRILIRIPIELEITKQNERLAYNRHYQMFNIKHLLDFICNLDEDTIISWRINMKMNKPAVLTTTDLFYVVSPSLRNDIKLPL